MGVYPLLQEETCRFLAADFDGEEWRDDVVAFLETCRALGVPAAVERSRSGNGGHAWFFFASPVAASEARGDTSSAWRRTTGSSRTRTPCRAAVSAI